MGNVPESSSKDQPSRYAARTGNTAGAQRSEHPRLTICGEEPARRKTRRFSTPSESAPVFQKSETSTEGGYTSDVSCINGQPPPDLPRSSGEEQEASMSGLFSPPKIGGDTEGVDDLTSCTPWTFCRLVRSGEDTEGVVFSGVVNRIDGWQHRAAGAAIACDQQTTDDFLPERRDGVDIQERNSFER